jgi:porphobilinogen synthase
MSSFPKRRLRRLRRTESLRALRRETVLRREDLVYPLFLVEDPAAAGPVPSMPGVARYAVSELDRQIESIQADGLRAVLLFGVPKQKDARGASAHADDGVVPAAIRRIRATGVECVIVTDVCLCQYTDHGHCGILRDHGIDNDRTLEVLGKTAAAHARAGADIVAPSGMIDGMVQAIRSALDEGGFDEAAILSYAAKYASAFYGPFREAADSAPQFGDRKSYQMDPPNAREALAEVALDIEEGADAVMVKPAMPYLDIVRRVRDTFPQVPLAAYQVSGEYSMIKAAVQQGWLDERKVFLESLTAIKRAGADMIITYFARDASRMIDPT